MKFDMVGSATFTGALTKALIPPIIDDPGTFGLSVDVTVPATGNFSGTFARLGITEFGDNPTQMVTGGSVQTNAVSEANIDLVPGTYHILMPLFARNNPITFDADVTYSSCFGPNTTNQLQTATSFQFYFNKANTSALTAYLDNVQAVPVGQAAAFIANNSLDNWSAAASWEGGVPSGAGVEALFGSAITAAETVNVDSPQTVGTIEFNNSFAYTLSGSALTIDTTGGAPGIVSVLNGQHVITAPLQLNQNTNFLAAGPGDSLTVSNLTATGKDLTLNGLGTLEVNNVRSHGLTINNGLVKITPAADPTNPSSNAGVSVISSLSVSPTAKLDLTNNKLILPSATLGTFTGGAYTGVTGLVASGRNGGAWNGPGIITSSASGNLTTLAVATADQIGKVGQTFGGVTLSSGDVLVMYTYGGDANLDGKINIDDYGRIDGNVGLSGTVFGWYNGDFNYDGKINIDDYGIIDGNIGIQGAPISTAAQPLAGFASAGVAAVPEPMSMGMLAILGAVMMRRRVIRRGV